MNMIVTYAVASAVCLGLVFAEIILIIKNYIKANKCQKHIKIKNVNRAYSWWILALVAFILTAVIDIFWFSEFESFSENVERILSITYRMIFSAAILLSMTFGRTDYITENGITGMTYKLDKGSAQYSVKRIGGETLLKLYTKFENPDFTYVLKKKTEQEALVLVAELYPEYNGEHNMKRNWLVWKYTLFYFVCVLICTGSLTAWYFAEMPVVFVGDKIVKTNSECAIFDYSFLYSSHNSAVIPNDILEKILSEVDSTNKLTSKDITALKKLPNLKYLDVLDNNITDLTIIGELTQLEMLRFGGGIKIETPKDFSPLKNLKNIKYFTGAGCSALNDLTLFEDMDELVYFELTTADIQSGLDIICEKENLLDLNLFKCTSEDFSPIGKCSELKQLTLAYTNVTDLSFLEYLTELEYLDIDNVKAEDYSILLELPSLKKLGVRNCDIPNEIITELTEKGVKIYD